MLNQKSVLARLLANENITVTQGNYPTAFFNVETRELGLPLWKNMGKDVYDLLVGHEVSHALYTPKNFYEYISEGIPHSWLNIVEDVRIEKLILRKYPGLISNFKRGYSQLINGEDDIFELRDKDISKFGFMDRLNIHTKARDAVEVPFASDELPYVNQVKACETYEDVVQACRDIQVWLKQKAEDQKNQEDQEENAEDEGLDIKIGILSDDVSEDGEVSDEKPDVTIDMRETKLDEEGDKEGDEKGESEEGASEEGDEEGESEEGEANSEPESGLMDQEVLTQNSFDQNASKLVEKGLIYVKAMDHNAARSHIVPYADLAEARRDAANHTNYFTGQTHKFPEDKYVEFLKETKQIVNLMVKEFEMRKAAWRSLRARESTKGTIDVNKLHKYRYDDMLFKQSSHLADAKNHGMMMLIDYSGSMHNSMPGVLRQTLTLLMFCKRVGIPFEVYSFTSIGKADSVWGKTKKAKATAKTKNTCFYDEDLAMLNLFSSSMTKRDYEEAFRMVFWQSVNGRLRSEFEQLGNTPLNAALIATNYLIDDFREKHRVQKMSLVTLTDGDSNGSQIQGGADLESVRSGSKWTVDVNGKMLDLGAWRGEDTVKLVKAISDKGVSTINYFIASGWQFNAELSRSLGYARKGDADLKTKQKEARNTGVAVLDDNMGYNRRFIVPASSVDADVEDLKVNGEMTTKNIAKAFSKANGSKKKSKVITQKFAELVA